MGDFDKGFSKSMKLLGTLPLAALGQFYDYSSDDVGKFGALQVVNAGSASSLTDNQGDDQGSRGHGGNKRYCHTTGHGELVYNWTSNTNGGYFAKGRNIVQCIGEELYCFIEERAQFGQIIGITAGCEQMMNHPSVNIQDQQSGSSINAVKNNYNQEAARGGTGFHGLTSFYGIGGCLSMPAQNGHEFVQQDDLTSSGLEGNQWTGTDGTAWRDAKWNNYYRYFHGGFGQNQCLRFPKRNNSGAAINSPGNLLPFGVSVCRACCIAEFMAAAPTTGTADKPAVFYHICNYPPALDATITARTNAANEEIIPRFDMQSVATNQFKDGSTNNLFVHNSNCATAGRARGCGIDGTDYYCDGSKAKDTGSDKCPGE